MDWLSLGYYLAIAGVAYLVHLLARTLSVQASFVALVVGLVLGRTGFQVLEPMAYQKVLPAVFVHVAILFGALGHRLGRGMLRQPVLVVLRRCVPAAAVAAASLGVAAVPIPFAVPGAEPQRSFYRFALPLACVLSIFPLLALRDLRERPPSAGGSHFLVVAAVMGATYSFTPHLLWAPVLDPGILWRGPIIVLGESGALGVGVAVVHLFLTRRLGFPRVPGLLLGGALLAVVTMRVFLWLPFAALGFGIALGRAGEPDPGLPRGGDWIFVETPFLLLVTLTFAPDLFFDAVALPAIGFAAALAGLLLAVRKWVPRGRTMVTGPGLLFLGLALTVRLDGRMSPISRYVIDFALPAWILVRVAMETTRRRRTVPVPEARGGAARR